MKAWRYSHWDGTQDEFTLDPKRALDALSELLMEGLSVEEALEWMRRSGFPLAGMNFRVMGAEELIDELRARARELMQRYLMDRATDELARRLDDILDREERAQRETHGLESRSSPRSGPRTASSSLALSLRCLELGDSADASERVHSSLQLLRNCRRSATWLSKEGFRSSRRSRGRRKSWC